MGFDNDCILNIQSLAGEYFCPVCRLLVYPNEALQSQCTHLYCKPCLTYIISTTQACPYDGYLVTEADSKPLTESNQALAETIGKIQVHCLFHRSGCTWQGPLSECTNHCSECAFGNSHVVCNRCSIQILHRQVQEHAQNCPGVQVQVQQAAVTQENAATATAVSSNQTQSTTQAGTATSQSQPSQTTAMPVQDPSQQASSNSQGQAAVQTSLPTHEQWYQQQQYQQYYQQYPGYDPYQQRYQQNYPYQQQAFGQYQQNFQAHTAQVGQQQPFQPYLQAQPQPQGPAGQQFQPQAQPQPQGPAQQQLQPQVQPQPQSLLPVPTHMASQTQVQANQLQQPQPAVQAQNQLLPQAHPNTLTQTQPHPQGQPHSALPPVQHPQMPLYQQPYPQMPISQPAAHSLSQQHLLRPQPQPHPQALPQPLPNMQLQTQHPSSHAVTNNQSYPQVQPQIQFPQQMQLAATHQQPMQVHAQGPHQLQCPQPPQTHPLVQSKAPIYQQHQAPVPSHGQASVALLAQMQQIQPHLQQVGHHIQQHPNMGPAVQTTPLVQNQSYGGQLSGQQQQLRQPIQGPLRSQGPSHTFQQTHGYPHPQQTASSHGVQPHQSHYSGARPVTPTHLQSQPYVQSTGVLQGRQVQFGTNGTSGDDKTEAKVLDAGAGTEHDNLKSVKSRADIKSVGDDSKPIGLVEDKSTNANTSAKGIPESELQKEENGNPINKHMVKEEILGSSLEQSDVQKLGEVVADNQKIFAEESGDEKNKFQKVPNGQQDGNLSQMPGYSQMQAKGAAQSANLVLGADRGIHQPSTHREALTLQQRSAASSGLHSPSGRQHILLPGYSSNEHGLQGHGHFPHPRQQPYGPETPSSHQSAPQGPYNQRKVNPPHSQLPGPSYIDNKLPALQHSVSPGQGPFGQPSDIHASMSRNRPLASETLRDQNPLHLDPGQRRFDDDLNRFPRPSHPSHLYTEHVSENWSNFPSSRPFDGVPHGFGDIAPRPPNNEHLGRSPGGGLHPLRLGPSEAGLRPVALINDPTRSLNSSHTHPDFQGHIPGHGRRHMDGRLPRNSPGEYLGISRGGLSGGPGRNIGLEDMDFRELRQFGDPLGNEFHIGRFPLLPSQARRIEFDGRGDSRMDEQFRDHASFGNFPSNPRFRSFPDHPPTPGELLGGNRPNHPKPGEPGFRSSFILQGDRDHFDNSRKKKLVISMGWCRICKVDCETVEGLDLHSQTREHQQMAMDMVRSIKQNAKKRHPVITPHLKIPAGLGM